MAKLRGKSEKKACTLNIFSAACGCALAVSAERTRCAVPLYQCCLGPCRSSTPCRILENEPRSRMVAGHVDRGVAFLRHRMTRSPRLHGARHVHVLVVVTRKEAARAKPWPPAHRRRLAPVAFSTWGPAAKGVGSYAPGADVLESASPIVPRVHVHKVKRTFWHERSALCTGGACAVRSHASLCTPAMRKCFSPRMRVAILRHLHRKVSQKDSTRWEDALQPRASVPELCIHLHLPMSTTKAEQALLNPCAPGCRRLTWLNVQCLSPRRP